MVLKIFANGDIILSAVDMIFADDVIMLFEDVSSRNKWQMKITRRDGFRFQTRNNSIH